jgi:hypothetical protein
MAAAPRCPTRVTFLRAHETTSGGEQTKLRRSSSVSEGAAMAGYYCPKCLKAAPMQKVCCGRPMKRG